MELQDRKMKILQAIIRNYLETGEPVGSRTISKYTDLKLSSATIRNEMADLEEMGLIMQPHTSAGRIPSDAGYRLYVDNMLSSERQQVDEMKALVDKLKGEYNELKGRLDSLSATLIAVSEAQEQHGAVTDEKARNIIALYGALLAMSQKAGADAEDAVRNASYILYAYLGGQARRDITYVTDQG
jgi:heat-inducible transcriptional repressor